jgi:ubiquinone/menaquinone biosynthesis C-methylase UbiE
MSGDYTDYERNAYNSKLFAQRQWHRKRVSETVSALGSARKLLDVGCGSGLLIEQADVNLAIGADSDKETLIINSKRDFGKKAFFVVADATALPFKDAAFDAVASTEVIEHISDPESFVKEAARVLAARGKAVITTPNYSSAWPLVETVWSRHSGARDYTECHVSHFTAKKLRTMLERNGLAVKSLSMIHSMVMLSGTMETVLRPVDHFLTRSGLGMVMICLAEKTANKASETSDTALKSTA